MSSDSTLKDLIEEFQGFDEFKKEMAANWVDDALEAGIYACQNISNLGYNFQKQTLYFKNYDSLKWLDSFAELKSFRNEDFERICPKNPNEISENLTKIETSKRISDYDKKNTLKRVKAGIQICTAYVKERCENVRHVDETDLIYSYQTKGCELREVTTDDVEKDIEKFKSYGSTDADLKSHGSITNILKFCKIAKDKDYRWTYQVPKIDKSECLKK